MSSSKISLRNKIRDPQAWKRFFSKQGDYLKMLPTIQRLRWQAWLLHFSGLGAYKQLTEKELLATRKSDTLFLFGSGYSINQLTPAECRYFERHNTMSFNWFAHQNLLRIDYHIAREITAPPPYLNRVFHWVRNLNSYARLLKKPFYANTIYILQKGWMAISSNRLIGLSLLPSGARIFRYTLRSRGKWEPPTDSLSKGIVHGPGSLAECVNFAYAMGWKHIVLVGVDLYDSRYFWLPPEGMRSEDAHLHNYTTSDSPHATGRWMIDFMAYWKPLLEAKNVRVEIYNPKSLLNSVFRVFDRSVILESQELTHADAH